MMADTNNYFSTDLPHKFSNDPSFQSAVQSIYQFEIDGAGTWHIVPGEGVLEGAHAAPDCVVGADKETFDAILDDSSLVMMKFMEGKITASDMGLAMGLTSFLD
jgi:putative sterol carrier protein